MPDIARVQKGKNQTKRLAKKLSMIRDGVGRNDHRTMYCRVSVATIIYRLTNFNEHLTRSNISSYFYVTQDGFDTANYLVDLFVADHERGQ